MHKSRSVYRDGFKAHLAVEPDTGLITAAELTPANAPDGTHGVRLLDGEPAGLDVLADSAYGTGPVRANLEAAGHTAIIKPWPLARNPRLGADQLHRDEFTIDYTARTVTCPNGITVTIAAKGSATFGQRCNGCPLRSRCTANIDGKTVHVGEHDQRLAAARQQWRGGLHLDDYRQHRPMVERTLAWIVANGHRRVRYRGVERNQLGLNIRAATINLRRLLNLGLHWNNSWQITT
jgi:IS5 family transposase